MIYSLDENNSLLGYLPFVFFSHPQIHFIFRVDLGDRIIRISDFLTGQSFQSHKYSHFWWKYHYLPCVNPYWQIMENSSRNFSEIFIFRVVTQAVLLENSSIKNHEYLFSFFFNSGASHRPFYWKTHPAQMLHIIYGFSQKDEWMSFPVKRPVWRPGKWKFQKHFWMSFPWFADKG